MSEQPVTIAQVDALASSLKDKDVNNLKVIRQQVLRRTVERLEQFGTFGYEGHVAIFVNGGYPLVKKVCDQLTQASKELDWTVGKQDGKGWEVLISPKV